ncbi:hypothetical protein [Clostridium estertheticum]|uniref:hypothetical protein n=1 Tax=Clostridium estertheticum TaxID=238834 RepID=UPI001C0E7029|nr:hypothetical protein [Clostridium estertheticum]MBU3186669.1 hypothetical protein [Clostridium estertheticum]
MTDVKCEKCNEPTILVKELTKRVDKLENRQDKSEDKLESSLAKTNESISSLRESHSETRAYAKATLEQISDIKSMFKSNNDSNLAAILSMVKDNTAAMTFNNKTNLESNQISKEISKDIEISKGTNKVEVTKGKLVLYATIITGTVTLISLIIDKIL